MAAQEDSIFSLTSFVSLLAVVVLLAVGYYASNALLAKNTRRFDRGVFIWLVFDGLLHLSFEGSFLYTSSFGRSAQTGEDWTAALWREYAKADLRWGVSDPLIVSMEILTVVIGGPLALYCAYLLVKKSGARHPWLLILSTGELYGGWMTFCPDWLIGSPNLRTDNFLHLWVYLALMNGIWVVIPFIIMVDSFKQIIKAFESRVSVSNGRRIQ